MNFCRQCPTVISKPHNNDVHDDHDDGYYYLKPNSDFNVKVQDFWQDIYCRDFEHANVALSICAC